MTDNVSHPAHYTGGGIEAKDALKAVMGCAQECFIDVIDGKPFYKTLTPMAFYWWGCAFKYLWRWTSLSPARSAEERQFTAMSTVSR